jgi:hypothetical protein
MRKPQTIYNWKKYGIKSDDYDKLYEYHMSIERCELCSVLFDKTPKNRRCLDHDHDTGLYRKTLCNTCNFHYKKSRQKLKSCNTTGHMWISNHKTFNKKYNKYYFSWRYERKIDGKRIRKAFKTKTKAIAYSFLMLLKEPF